MIDGTRYKLHYYTMSGEYYLRSTVTICAATLAVVAFGAPGRSQAAGQARALDQLAGCANVSGRDEKLACFEQATAQLRAAVARGDVVVVDREQAQAVRRQAFGFSLPSLDLFAGGKAAPLDHVDGRLAAANRGPDGWTFRLEDGSAWTQVDTDPILVVPRPGQAVAIRTGMMGAYFLGLDGHAGVRVRRVR